MYASHWSKYYATFLRELSAADQPLLRSSQWHIASEIAWWPALAWLPHLHARSSTQCSRLQSSETRRHWTFGEKGISVAPWWWKAGGTFFIPRWIASTINQTAKQASLVIILSKPSRTGHTADRDQPNMVVLSIRMRHCRQLQERHHTDISTGTL